MNFYQLNLFIEENPIQDTPSQTNVDVNFRQLRKQGILHAKDPLNKYKINQDIEEGINVVWITGMYSGMWPGTGKYGPLLKSLGYNIKVIKTAADPVAAATGRISNTIDWEPLTRASQYFASRIVNRNQDKVGKELGGVIPDLIVGSSQGGAIALSLAPNFPEIPMILVAPAWKIFHIKPTYLNPKSIIIHGKRDVSVPTNDSLELAEITGLSPSRIILTNDGHIISNGFSRIIEAIFNLTKNLLHQKKVNAKRRYALENKEISIHVPKFNFYMFEA
jgi:hypothetical protein